MDVSGQLKAALADRYTIEREIGAGGMATVFLARDVKHNRKVALKVLRPELGAVLGIERFLSEIEVTANLQHPHLLPLFDSGEVEGLLFYVMPYIAGESLRDRLDRERQLPVDEAIRIAVAVCSALDYAHRHGVIHRDLKPENIMLHESQPMVTDFGIALAISNAGGARVTQTGLSLGTPQYMSPEQATGDRVIDARSDIYSLAAVLYEMLTGEPPHLGNTVQAIIAKVLTDRPQHVRHLRESVPVHVDAAIQCALSKLPADRFATASDFADALNGTRTVALPEAAFGIVNAAGTRTWTRSLPMFAAGVLAALGLFLLAATMFRDEQGLRPPMLFNLAFSDSVQPVGNSRFALSGDGAQLAFVGRGPAGTGIYLRRLDSFATRLVAGTERGGAPRFSPDGTTLLFGVDGQLKTVPVSGGSPVTIVRDSVNANQVSWGDDGAIVFGYANRLWRVPAGGGARLPIPVPDSVAGVRQRFSFPESLPGGKSVLVSFVSSDDRRPGSVFMSPLDQLQLAVVRLRDGQVRQLGVSGLSPRFANGMIVFARADRTLWAARFSARRLKLLSEPVQVMEGVDVGGAGYAGFAIADNGTLIYNGTSGTNMRRLVRVNRAGTDSTLLDHAGIQFPRIQPGGRRIALEIPWREVANRYDVWTYDLVTRTLERITTDSISARPDWSPDGSRITYASAVSPWIVRAQPWDGSGAPETLFKHDSLSIMNVSMGPAGRYSIVEAVHMGPTRRVPDLRRIDLWIVPNDSPQAMRRFLATPARDQLPRVSPNGRLVAYESDESEVRTEIYVRTVPGPGPRIQVSTNGGVQPVWSPNGKELFYRGPTHLMAAQISETPVLDRVRVDSLFPDRYSRIQARWNYDVFPSGNEFVFMINPEQGQRPTLFGIANWLENALATRRAGN